MAIHPRKFHRAAAVAATACALAVAGPARASTLSCGDTLGAGAWLLETDLVCDSASGSGVGLTLTSGASLDLGGHSIAMSIAGSGTAVALQGTGATLAHGTVTSADRAVLVTGGGHHLKNLTVSHSNSAVYFQSSDGNTLTDSQLSGNASGVALVGSNRNVLDKLVVDDSSSMGNTSGIYVNGSNDNVITRNEVLRTGCTGIFMTNASRNLVCFNTVQDSYSIFSHEVAPSVNIVLRDASSGNVVCQNQVSATTSPSPTYDGINVGCRDFCYCDPGNLPFSLPSTGANGNLILGNTANGESRYGIAQAPGNTGNVYAGNHATGNGVANYALGP